MKYIWEADDIKPGRMLGTTTRGERWIIGYREAEVIHDRCDLDATHRAYVLISLSDGMVTAPRTAETMAVHLNESGEIPAEMLPPWSKAI